MLLLLLLLLYFKEETIFFIFILFKFNSLKISFIKFKKRNQFVLRKKKNKIRLGNILIEYRKIKTKPISILIELLLIFDCEKKLK